jgi:hypothetical protein
MKAAVKKAEEMTAILRREQFDLLKTARKAVALRAAVERIVPRRIVSLRVPGKYFRVVSDAPAMQELYKGNKPPGSFSVEPLKAIAGARGGKWRIVEEQDLTIDPSEIKTTWSDGPLPEEIGLLRTKSGKSSRNAEDSRNALIRRIIVTEGRLGDDGTGGLIMERKLFRGEVKGSDDDKLIVEAVITTEHRDRVGILRAGGVDREPVVLFGHGRGRSVPAE